MRKVASPNAMLTDSRACLGAGRTSSFPRPWASLSAFRSPAKPSTTVAAPERICLTTRSACWSGAVLETSQRPCKGEEVTSVWVRLIPFFGDVLADTLQRGSCRPDSPLGILGNEVDRVLSSFGQPLTSQVGPSDPPAAGRRGAPLQPSAGVAGPRRQAQGLAIPGRADRQGDCADRPRRGPPCLAERSSTGRACLPVDTYQGHSCRGRRLGGFPGRTVRTAERTSPWRVQAPPKIAFVGREAFSTAPLANG